VGSCLVNATDVAYTQPRVADRHGDAEGELGHMDREQLGHRRLRFKGSCMFTSVDNQKTSCIKGTVNVQASAF
jgi:hypothetical protein